VKIGIIGGGVSGLYFAWLCHENQIPFTLLESSSRLGGALETSRNEHGVIELGAHTLYNTYEECLRWIEVLGLRICKKSTLPFTLKCGDEYRSIFKSVHKIEALWHLLFSWRLKKKSLSIQEKFSTLLGKRNYQEWMKPLFNALLNQEADAFPADWIFKKRKKNKRYPEKFTLEGGLSTLVETVESKIKESVFLNAAPKNIEKKNLCYFLETDSQTFAFSHLVLATPIEQTAHYLKMLDLSTDLEGFSNVQTLSIAVDTTRSPLVPRMSLAIVQEGTFRSFLTNDDVAMDSPRRSYVFHFKNTEELNPLDAIQKALFLKKQNSLVVRHKKINTMPKITNENQKKTVRILEEVEKNSTLFLCGNAYGGISIEDCLQRSKKEFERFSAAVAQ
jgi:protoporphyrinogen oxidase